MSVDSDHEVTTIERPPTTILGILGRLGPGLIVAGSIVGSGELIATTKTGAEAGFWLLWLIIIGCVIKVFAQVEFGRYSIVAGRTTMDGLNEVPGPTAEFTVAGRTQGGRFRGNWIVWYWFLMWFASIGQLGGIVGGVGQALAISVPLTERGERFNHYVDAQTSLTVKRAELTRIRQRIAEGDTTLEEEAAAVQRDLDARAATVADLGERPPSPADDKLWAALVTAVTAVVLVLGRYRLIQTFSTVMVASFTAVTVINLIMLQANPTWAVQWQELIDGLSFRLPPVSEMGGTALATALATFGIIGVGASELVSYPYWCLEKGYARFTGPRDASPEWAERARGWMRVMRWDAWCSMVIYTFATIAFYLLGAAILFRTGLNPGKDEMIRTLAVMYEPVFGEHAQVLFLFGAFAVLYSTFFVANAGHARVFSDALRVLGFGRPSEHAHRRRVRVFSGLFPMLSLTIYVFVQQPARLVLISGLMQAMMLPMLAIAALYFHYFRGDDRLPTTWFWDVFLWLSACGMGIAGIWAGVTHLWD